MCDELRVPVIAHGNGKSYRCAQPIGSQFFNIILKRMANMLYDKYWNLRDNKDDSSSIAQLNKTGL